MRIILFLLILTFVSCDMLNDYLNCGVKYYNRQVNLKEIESEFNFSQFNLPKFKNIDDCYSFVMNYITYKKEIGDHW